MMTEEEHQLLSSYTEDLIEGHTDIGGDGNDANHQSDFMDSVFMHQRTWFDKFDIKYLSTRSQSIIL